MEPTPDIYVTRTRSTEQVDQILRDPGIYPLIREDGSPPPEEFTVGDLAHDDDHYFLCAVVQDHVAGVVIFHPVGPNVYQSHLNVLPAFCGRGLARKIAVLACRWMFDNTDCVEITAKIPDKEDCDPVRRVAEKIGMRPVMYTVGTYRLDGNDYDEWHMSLSRETLTGD